MSVSGSGEVMIARRPVKLVFADCEFILKLYICTAKMAGYLPAGRQGSVGPVFLKSVFSIENRGSSKNYQSRKIFCFSGLERMIHDFKVWL